MFKERRTLRMRIIEVRGQKAETKSAKTGGHAIVYTPSRCGRHPALQIGLSCCNYSTLSSELWPRYGPKVLYLERVSAALAVRMKAVAASRTYSFSYQKNGQESVSSGKSGAMTVTPGTIPPGMKV